MAAEPHAHGHTSVWTYVLVWAGLIVLTLTTVFLSYLNLGEWHTPVGLLIALAKAALIVLFFMHTLESNNRLVWMILTTAVLLLAVMYGLTFSDYLTRGTVDAGVRNPGPQPARPAPPPPPARPPAD